MQMELHYEYTTKASDLWQVSMYYVYSSFMAIVNVIAIISAVVLMITYYSGAGPVLKGLMIMYLLMFTVIQPLSIYFRAKRQTAGHEKKLELTFSDGGIEVCCGGEVQTKKWNEIRSFLVKPTLVVIYTGSAEGYILTNGVLGNTRSQLIELLKNKTAN